MSNVQKSEGLYLRFLQCIWAGLLENVILSTLTIKLTILPVKLFCSVLHASKVNWSCSTSVSINPVSGYKRYDFSDFNFQDHVQNTLNKVNKSKGSIGKLRNVFPKAFSSIFCLFVYLLFLLCTWISSDGHQRFAEQSRKGGDHTHSSLPLPLTRERLGTYLYVGWVPRILNCISCNYQAAARWGLSSSMN